MAFRLSKQFLIGQVIKRGYEKIPTVEVRVPQMVLDKYLLMYFNHPETYWAAEPESMTCKVGDIVKIQKLPERVTPITTHQVCERVFKIGEIVDPVTGRRCRGTKFIDEENRKLTKEKYEKESGSILQ